MDCFEERRQVLLQELAALSGEGALYGFLMRQGEQLPPFAEEWKTEACLLRGCQYRVWLRLELAGGLVRIDADRDVYKRQTSPGATLVTRKAPSGLVVEESGTGREARYYEYKADWSGIWKYIRRLSSSGDMIENILENADGKILRILHSNGAVMVDQYNAEYNGFGQIVCEQQKNECPLWYHYNNRGEPVSYTHLFRI